MWQLILWCACSWRLVLWCSLTRRPCFCTCLLTLEHFLYLPHACSLIHILLCFFLSADFMLGTRKCLLKPLPAPPPISSKVIFNYLQPVTTDKHCSPGPTGQLFKEKRSHYPADKMYWTDTFYPQYSELSTSRVTCSLNNWGLSESKWW